MPVVTTWSGRRYVAAAAALVMLLMWPGDAAGADDIQIIRFGGEGTDQAAAVAGAPDGELIVAGNLSDPIAVAADVPTRQLLESEPGENRAFVAKMSPDFKTVHWLTLLPSNVMEVTRLAVGEDGTIVLGGRQMSRVAELAPDENWRGRQSILASITADGKKLNWLKPGGPNQGSITGLAIDEQGRVYFTAGTLGRGHGAYLLRYAADGGDAPWSARGDRSWCVDLHHNAEDLRQPGEFWAFYWLPYDEDKIEGEDGYYDFDGEGGWAGVRFNPHGMRVGGQVLVLPDGDVVVTGGMQYDFRVKGKRGFPAFDLFLARYSPEGKLRWSTNLYQEGDSVHTPDQKPLDLAYDKTTGDLIVLVKQHGSNVYRFKGDLIGDTGNMMISWVGRVNADDGALKAGWYFQNNRHGNFDDKGKPVSPPYPDLAGNNLERVMVDDAGLIYVAGNGGAKTWTSPDAWRDWPADQNGGWHGTVYVLEADLSGVKYGTVLRGSGGESMRVAGMHIVDGQVWVAGNSDSSALAYGPQPKWIGPTDKAPGREAVMVRLLPPVK